MTGSGRSFRSQVLRNTASSAVANGWAIATALVALPLVLSGLGQEAFGAWVLIGTFSATNGWFSLADMGLTVATTRAVAAAAADDDLLSARRVGATSVLACAGLGGIAGVALASVGVMVLPFVFDMPAELTRPVRVALVAYSVQVLVDLVVNSLQSSLDGMNRVDLARVVDVVRRTLTAALVSVAAIVTGSLVLVAAASLVAALSTLVVAGLLVWRHVGSLAVRPVAGQVRELFRDGRAAALLRPLGVVQRMMDRVIVGVLLGPAAVALVEIATRVQAAADAVLSSSSLAVVPASSWLDRLRDHRALGELAERGTKYSVLVTAPMVVAVGMLSSPLVDVWLGSAYSDAAGLASVAVLNIALAAPLAVGSQMLLGTGRAGTIARAASIALAVNLVASIVLVEVIGLVGAFVGTVIAAAMLIPLLGIPVLQMTGLGAGEFVRASVLPAALPVSAQVVAITIVLVQGWSSWAALSVGGVVGLIAYAVVAVAFVVRPRELRQIRSEFGGS